MPDNINSKKKDRRKNPRVGVHIWAKEQFQNAIYFNLLSNLSIGGFFIKKNLPFPVGSVVELELELPDSNQRLRVKGIVINNYNANDSAAIGTGIQFCDIKESVKKNIERYLEHLID